MLYFFTLIESILILVILISTTFWLKHRGIIDDSTKPIFSKMTTDYALPALIFSSLCTKDINWVQLYPVFIMLGASIIVLIIAYFIGKFLRLSSKQLGVFIVLAGFGSSSSLGYPLIKEIFPNNVNAMTEALVIGELGACIPFFIIGVAIIIFFGGREEGKPTFGATLIPFLRSPIFLSLVFGVIFAFLDFPPENVVFSFVIRVLSIIGGTLIVFVAISVGLMIKPVRFRTILPLVLAVSVLKLIIDPGLAIAGSSLLAIPKIESEVLVIESAMPSGVVATVVADRYGCDGEFASIVVIITYLLALFTIPLMSLLDIYKATIM